MANRDLVVTEVLEPIVVNGERAVHMVRTTLEMVTVSKRAAKSFASFFKV